MPLEKYLPDSATKGCKMSMYGFGGFSGIQYTSYYYINRVIKDTYYDSKLFAGAFAGTFSVSITYPTDLVRKITVMKGFDKTVPVYNGIFDCCKIYKSENIKTFIELNSTYVKTGPAVAIQFWTIKNSK